MALSRGRWGWEMAGKPPLVKQVYIMEGKLGPLVTS